MMNRRTSENRRYLAYRIGAHVAWWSAFAWTAALTAVNLSRSTTAVPMTFQRVSELFIILLMGMAFALSAALTQMRLARTVASVFETGMRVSMQSEKED